MAVTDFHPMQSLAPKTTEWIKHVVERKAPIQDCCSVGMDEHSHALGKAPSRHQLEWCRSVLVGRI